MITDVLGWQRAYIDAHPETGTDELLDATEARFATGVTVAPLADPSTAWELHLTVSAPTRDDAMRWTRGIADMIRTEFGDSMGLDIATGPVGP